MATKTRADFTDILIRKKVLGPEQLEEARSMASQTGTKLQDALVKLNYASAQEVMGAIAEHHGMQFVDLKGLTIPPSVIEMVPESVARENVIIPLSHENNALQIVMSDPTDFDTIQKLQFILNKDIQPVLSDREEIIEAINRHYGQTETESVDSMLSEFTDTQIDFTETEATSGTRRQRRERCAGRQAREPDHSGSDQPAGQRHPHRAVRRPRPRPLPDRRRAGRARQPAAPAAGPADLAHQDHGEHRHLRKAASPGRPNQDDGPGQTLRPARQRAADGPRPVGRHAHPGPQQYSGEHQRPRLSRTTTTNASRRSSNGPTASSW